MENLDYTEGAGKQDRSFVFPVAASDTQKIAAADVRRGLMSTVLAENSPLLSSQQLTQHKQYEAGEEVQAADLGKVAFGETNPAAGEEGVIVSPSVNSQPNYTEADTHSPASCGSEKSLLRPSQSDQVHTSAEDMGKGSGVNASNQPLPTTDTQQEKEKSMCSSLLYQMKKQQKQKAGRPFKKKTLMKMVKLLAIAQGWDSEATEIPKGNRCNDAADECQESKHKVKPEMPEAIIVGTSSDKSLGYNSTLDSIDSKMEDCLNTTPPENSEDIAHVSQIALPKPLMDLNKPCKRKPCKRNSKTTQRTKTPEMHSTTAPKDLSVPVEQGLTHGTLSLADNVCSFDKTPRNALMVQKKPLKQKALTLMEEMGLSQSDRLPALFQNNSATSHEKCPSLPTEVYLSDMKTGPVDLTFAGNMAVKRNSMKQRNQISKKNLISTECCSIHPGMPLSKPGENEPFETDVTPHYQVQSACNKVTINGAGACTTAVGIGRNMCMKTEEPGGKSIGDVLKLKRKPGRPFKKRTLLKMAKLMPQVHEDEVAAPKSQQDVTSLQPIKSKMKNKKDTKNPVSNVTPSRRSSRTNKRSQMLTEEMMHCLSQSPPTEHALPMSSGPAVSILKPEDAACTPSTASLIGIGSAELALQNESHSFDECNIKNTKIKKSIVTSEGSYHSKLTPESKVLPEIVSTKKGLQKTAERKKTGIGAKNKCKQGGSASDLLSLNGISQQNIHAHTDQDKMSCSLPTPTGTNHQKPCKHGIRHKKCKEEVIEVPTSISSVSQSQSGVPNLSASPEAPLLPSCVKTESDSEAPRIAEKSNSKTSRDKRRVKMSSPQPSEIKTDLSHVLPAKAKTSRKRKLPSREPVVNAKRAIILRADATLGEIPSTQLGCDSAKYEKEALSSGTSDNLASKSEPHKGKGSRRKLKEADLTSNHDIKNSNFGKKARVKKGIIGKTDNLNHPQSEVNNAVAENNSIVPAQNPANTVKPKRKMSNLLSSCVSQPVPPAVASASDKEPMAQSDCPNSRKRKPRRKEKLCKKSPKPPRQKNKAGLGNTLSKNKQDPEIMFADTDTLVPEMEKGIEKKIEKKGTRNKGNLNMSSTHSQSEVNSADKSPNQNPPKLKVASVSNKRQLTESDHPNSVRRKTLQKEKLSKKSIKPPRQKWKADLGNNVSEKVKTLGPKRKLVHGNNVSKDEDLEDVYTDVDNMLIDNEKGIPKKSEKKGRVQKVLGKIDKGGSSTCPQSKGNSAVNKLIPSAPNPNTGKRKLKSSIPLSCVSQPVPPAVASTRAGQMAESVSNDKMKREPQPKRRPCKKKPCQKDPPGLKRKVNNGKNLLTEKDLESLSVQGDKIVIATVKGRPKMECKAGKKVLELATSHEQENMVAALNESVSCSGTNIKNYSIFSGGTMVNSIEQKQDIVLLDSTDGSNRGPASQIANNSPDVTVEELKELCKTSLTKPPTKVAGLRKRFRRNRTGWDTRMKSKRHLSKLNSLNTVDVLPQTADNQTAELSFSSSLCNSMLDETIINTELNDQVGQSYNQLPESTACQNKDVLCDQKKTLRKVRQQTLDKRYKAQREKGSPKRVHEEIETICAMSTANTDLLRSDVKPRKPIQCFFCGRSFRHISAYTVHRRIHTGEKPYRCVKCGKRFAQLYKLHLHANTHKQPEPIRCPCCSLMFPNTDEFIAHFNIHMKGTKKKPSSIKHKRDGRKIMAQPHADCTDPSAPRNTSTPLRCLSCLKEFVNNDTLKMHMLQTNCRGFMPYTHNVSEMKFNKSPSFNIHERSHGPVEPYASVCGKGFDQLKGLGIYSHVHSGEKAFFCAHCDQTFSSLTSLRAHQSSYVCSEKTRAGGSKVDIEGFLVEQGVGGQINTPMYFKCQICKQLHRHWCQYILHLRAHTKTHPYLCETCGQQYNQVPEICVHCQVCCKKSGEERACKASLSEVWQEPPSLQNQTPKPYPEFPPSGYKEVPSPGSTSVISCGSEHLEKQPAKYRSCLPIRATCSRYLCARCGKSFNQWNKLWLHQKVHKQKGSSFPCTQCSLEFRFFGSYRDHMQEHAAQSPFSCPLCPKAFVVEAGLNAHLCECHEPRERLKCDTCGKGFKSFRNLEKHSVLHKGASSHYCLPCNISFSSTCALQDHLKTHKARLDIPLPVGPVEPFLFPYHCRKCKARFTSTDLLQAHQVFHLGAVSDAADPVSTSLCSKRSKTVRQEVIPVSSQQKQILPVTKRKNLFRYPHPDRLYVVPIMSSEPPVVISDTEEDHQVVLTSPSTCNSPINNAPVPVHDGHSNSNNASMDVSTPRLPESTSPPVVLINDIETIQCTPASQKDPSDMSVHVHSPPLPSTLRKDLEQNVLPQSKEISTDIDADDEGEDDHDDDLIEASTIVVMPRDKKQGGEGFECVECLAFFTDVSELHEHYIHHARGV